MQQPKRPDPDHGGVTIENGTVLVRTQDCSVAPIYRPPEGAHVIDARGKVVMPGTSMLIPISEFTKTPGREGSDGKEAVDPATRRFRAIDGINPEDPAFEEPGAAGSQPAPAAPGSANVLGGGGLLSAYGRSRTKCSAHDGNEAAFGEPQRVYRIKKDAYHTHGHGQAFSVKIWSRRRII